MKRIEIVGIAIFGLLVVGALVLAMWQGSRQRARLARYAADRRFAVLKKDDGLSQLVNDVAPDLGWPTRDMIAGGAPPLGVYFFELFIRGKGRSSSTTHWACLAERPADFPQQEVTIDVRVPLLSGMVEHRVEVGSEEFRKEYTVSCRDRSAAHRVINGDVQRILLEHATGERWNISVTVARRGVLVHSSWARKEPQWDYLIGLTKRLRDAVR